MSEPMYKLTGRGEFAADADVYFADKKIAEKASRIWNSMAAIHDPDAVEIDRYDAVALEEQIIRTEGELKDFFRKVLK